jgi:SAM-dependent methyltransferase
MGRIPERIEFAIETLEAREGDRVAEIGCGTGLALALLLRSGKFSAYGIDRSHHAVARGSQLNAAEIAAGRIEIARRDLAELPRDPFDCVFAVNVNIFWRDPRNAFTWAQEWVVPGGRLLLVFDAPSPGKLSRIVHSLSSTPLIEPFLFEGCRSGAKSTLAALKFRLPE